LPPQDKELRDLLHDTFCEYLKCDSDVKKYFYEEVDKRYRIYFEAFNMWTKNPSSGHMMGSVMIEIIKNQNSDFSLKKYLPLVGATEALKAFMLFSTLFKMSLESIGKIKKKFKIDI